VQALAAANIGVAVLPALALAAHRNPAVDAVPLPDSGRTISAAMYGDPPDPPGIAALVRHLAAAAANATDAVPATARRSPG
jgi:DNA-binding transcriptional LysR family regulator